MVRFRTGRRRPEPRLDLERDLRDFRRAIESHIKTQLNRYLGNLQVTQIGEDRWKSYPTWRRKNGKGRSGGQVSAATIRTELATFRSVMIYAAGKRYIPSSQLFRGRLPLEKAAQSLRLRSTASSTPSVVTGYGRRAIARIFDIAPSPITSS